MTKNNQKLKQVVGILGYGEIGQTMARICQEAGFKVLIRELDYDQIAGQKIDYLHVNIPEKNNTEFISLMVKTIKELNPKLTIINSSVSPGTTEKIQTLIDSLIVHSPVIGLHPNLYESVRFIFPKIIGPTSHKSLIEAKKHLNSLGLKVIVYDDAKTSESAKLLDLVYYAWNIIFCKEMKKLCDNLNLNFTQIYIEHNQIYNDGYGKLLPNVVRPILVPIEGPIGGHCTIPDTLLFDKYFGSFITKTILEKNSEYAKDKVDPEEERKKFVKNRNKYLVKNIRRSSH